ncbi:MAG: hypothetical protein HYX97_00720 [Chloroflexi bacterium]|nr:hypothetical protein [Chloroflexota bacterium]
MEKRWGYACEVHERVIAAENMDRYQEEAMFSNTRTPWGIGARNTA